MRHLARLTTAALVSTLLVASPPARADATRAIDVRAALETLLARPVPDALPFVRPHLPQRYDDATRGVVHLNTRVFRAGTTTTLTGDVLVDDDWRVDGTVELVDARVVFAADHEILVRTGGTLTVRGASSIRDTDDDRATGGIITGPGTISIEGTAEQPIPVVSTAVIATAGSTPAPVTVRQARFSDGVIGVATNSAATTVEHSTFTGMGTGVQVLAGANADPTIASNTFVDNVTGVHILGADGSKPAASGTVRGSEFQANAFGIVCVSPGSGGRRPTITGNNFRNHLAEAYSGVVGVTVTVPGAGTFTVSDSSCVVDGNHFADGDSRFRGGADEFSNDRPAPVATSAPASAVPVTVIRDPQTLTGSIVLEGPLVADAGGAVTIRDATLTANGHLWGSSTGGRLTTRTTQVRDNGLLVIRTNDDEADGLTFPGSSKVVAPLFTADTLHAVQWRNSAALDGWTADGFGTLLVASAGLLTETTAYRPSLNDVVARNGNTMVINGGVASITQSIARATIEDVVTGISSTLATTTLSDSTLRAVEVGYLGVLKGTFTSTGNRYEGGTSAVVSAAAGTVSMTNDVVASQTFGVLSVLDASFSAKTTTFACNAYGVAVADSPNVTVDASNFRDNYLRSLNGMDVALVVNGQPVNVQSRVQCKNCYFFRPDDRSWDPQGSDVIVVTEAPFANPAPDPSWLGDVLIADAGETKVVPATMTAPAIARAGGTLRAEFRTVNGARRFPVGAKTGGNGGGANGTLNLVASTFRAVRFLAIEGTDSTVRLNAFTDMPGGVELSRSAGTIECNAFDAVGGAVRFMRQQRTDAGLVFHRNLMTGSRGVELGFSDLDRQDATITENAYLDGTSPSGFVRRAKDGTVAVNDNNLLSALGVWEGANIPGAPVASRLDATGNHWNHSQGPTIVPNGNPKRGAALTRDPDADTEPAAYEPFRTAPHAPLPCAVFWFTPGSPSEVQTVTFEDRSIDPGGGGVVERTWRFGDGTADVVTAASAVTHRFPDGGQYPVRLTVRTAAGVAASQTRTVNVSNAAPVPSFVASAIDETQPVSLTDTSTHPNAADAPPSGWSYAWDVGADGSVESTARNPQIRFPDGGARPVKLTVTDDDGRSASATRTVTVPHVAPSAGFTALATDETAAVRFADASIHPNPADAPPSGWTYEWSFGSNERNPVFRFPDGGTRTVTLKVKDNDGKSATVTREVAVPHAPPEPRFIWDVPEPGTVSFLDRSRHPNAADAPPSGWTYRWDFGDGTTSSARFPVHSYSVTEGTFDVTLTVTDDDGQTRSFSRAVDVAHRNQEPQPAFTTSEPRVAGRPVAFTDASTDPDGTVVSWLWDFGDGTTSRERNPTHTFETGGDHQVTLTVTDDFEAVGSVTQIVHVCGPPGGILLDPPGIALCIGDLYLRVP